MDDHAPPETGEPLSSDDEALIDHARDAVTDAFDPDWFGGAPLVGAAIRGDSGEVYTGVSIPAGVGRASTCAEPAALSDAVIAGEKRLDASVAVRHPLPDEDREFEVVSACGVCREQLCDYDPDLWILFPTTDGPRKERVEALLPTRHW